MPIAPMDLKSQYMNNHFLRFRCDVCFDFRGEGICSRIEI